jgi:peptidoglycan hydrolase-like protein with peptidoglycan-binding domain
MAIETTNKNKGGGNKSCNCNCCPPYPKPKGTLRRHDKCDQVRWLQEALNNVMKAGLATDGSYGPLTEAAVKNFQKKYDLAVDGIFGPKSLAKMDQVYKGDLKRC